MSHSVLPVPLPAPPYTLRSLERYLDTLTLDGFDRNTPSLPYDFNRKARVLYRVASLYAELSGEEFGRIQGRTRDMLSFTERQFEIMAVVCYRATIDGTSYEYNLRRELGLPDDFDPVQVSRQGRERESGESGEDVQALAAEVRALRDELTRLGQERSGSVGVGAGETRQSADSVEVERLRRQVGELRGMLAEQEKVIGGLQERLDLVTADRSGEGEASQDTDTPSRADLTGLRHEVKGWNAQVRSDLKKELAGLEQLRELLEWNAENPDKIHLGAITDVKLGLATVLKLLSLLYESAELDFNKSYGAAFDTALAEMEE